jgi:hypothetical protein
MDPYDQKQMTSGTDAARPTQPTLITTGVNAVQPSRFAGWIGFERYAGTTAEDESYSGPTAEGPEVPPGSDEQERSVRAPLVHVAGNQKNLLVDVPFGNGSIAYLTDPYIVSNAGISIVDNAQLAINLAAASKGTIAFDEYHQGYGSDSNRFLQFFEGTPVVAMFLQLTLLTGLIFFSQSRRFARPIPESDPDRLSKLEYVTAMAELQQRTRAYDLAIENIYMDFRRRVTRALGVDNMTTSRAEIAEMIAERAGLDGADVEAMMVKCEDIIHGVPTGRAEVVGLTERLREIEAMLGLRRTPQDRAGR